MAPSMSDRTAMNQERRQAMMRTIETFVFAALCEIAGKTSRYADAIRRRADRAEYWAATHRDERRTLDRKDVAELTEWFGRKAA